MNKLIPIKAIGCPWHGRAIDDTFDGGPGPPYPTVATRPAGATWGPAIPIVHPNAPGSTIDSGTDRSWGMYIGHNRAINGASGGTGIEWNRWLYCDPLTDATWLMRAELTINTVDMDIDVYCDGVFGRYRPDDPYPTPTPRLVQSFTWTPDLPSWNGFGSVYTTAQVMGKISEQGFAHPTLSISRAGDIVYLHIYTKSGGLSSFLYGPTCDIPHYWGLNSGKALAGLVKITLSGSSTAAAGGAAITAAVVKDRVYEGTVSTGLCWSRLISPGVSYSHQAILYRAEDGDVTRNYQYTFSGATYAVTHSFWGSSWIDSGTAVSAYGGGCELIVFAQNAVYVATYQVAAYGGFANTFDQRWWGLDAVGNQVQMDSIGLLGSNYAATNSGEHEMPYTRKWVGTMSPHSPVATFEIYDAVYLTTYTGTTYQYI